MGENYAQRMVTRNVNLTDTETLLTPSLPAGVVVTALAMSEDEFEYASEENGAYHAAGLDASTNKYTKLFPQMNALSNTYFRSVDPGPIVLELDILLNARI